jgi:Ca-activated chloride channel family protein
MQAASAVKWHWTVLVFAVPVLAQLQPSFRVDVNLVRVPCVVADASGAPVPGLRREDFVVLEDGAPREVKYLWQEADLPLTVGLVADVSGSEYRFIEQHRQTVLQFLSQILSSNDHAFLVSVEKQQRLVTDLTNSIEKLQAGVEVLGRREAGILGDPCAGRRRRFLFTTMVFPCGGTALWNGVFFAAKLKLRPQPGRKAMLLLTDGWDTGSEHGLVDAIEACQGADTMVYSIRYADPAWGSVAARQLARGKRDLERITRETGGLCFEGESEKVPGIFNSIETALRSEYILGYTPTAARHRQDYHRITVMVARPGLTVRARDGYYAP